MKEHECDSWIPWCDFVINKVTLEVKYDYSKTQGFFFCRFKVHMTQNFSSQILSDPFVKFFASNKTERAFCDFLLLLSLQWCT